MPDPTPSESIENIYRCQFCGTDSPTLQWRQAGDRCPVCHRKYDYLLAQDEEDEP